MSKRMTWVAFCMGGLCLHAQGQTAPVAKEDPKSIAYFEQYIRPLLVQHCYQCHAEDSKRVRGGLLLDSRPNWSKGGDSGPVIIPGKPGESLFIQALQYGDDAPHMPPKGKLAEREIQALTEWVRMGAPDPRDKVTARQKERVIDIAKGKKHWSFLPLRQVEIPAIKSDWVRTSIDQFILAKLQAQNLQPPGPASPAKLVRRAYLDLLGLPPEPEVVAAFEQDPTAQNWGRLVDQLLASPHYGERWGRHWMDLARFAESHGFEHDYDRPNAYHYRDFVIKAFNSDMPYDRFVRWQLAGDELAPDDPMAWMATGFLAAGVHSTQITKSQVEKERYDELDDKLATTGTAMLGLTFGCARCHDHKYDPIPTADYYRMLSTFTKTVRSDYNVQLDPQGYRLAIAAFEKSHAPLVEAIQKYEIAEHPRVFAKWLESEAAIAAQFRWQSLAPTAAIASGGTQLATLPDDSILASGANPDTSTYQFTFRTSLTDVRALRLAAMTHDSLPKKGPGRAPNGNFALTDLQVSARPVHVTGSHREVTLKNVQSTFEQSGLPAKAAIDNDPRSGWAVDPQIGRDHSIVLEFDKPLGFYGGMELLVTLRFQNNKQHGLGRVRLAVSNEVGGSISAPVLTSRASELLGLLRSTGQLSLLQENELRSWHRGIDPRWQELSRRVVEHAKSKPQPNVVKALICSEGVPAVRLHTQGGDYLDHTHFLHRGDPNQKRAIATQSFLQVLMRSPEKEGEWRSVAPVNSRTSHQRAAFARWVTDVHSGAGPLLARVMVNRLWQHHFGRGIVTTPSDFGLNGARPTHPELLEWLAAEFIRSGWSVKHLHRLIMTSAVFQLSASADARLIELDPDNAFFSRWQPRRLEAEIIRDCILWASGTLDSRMFGPGTLDENHNRRSIYFTIKRSKLIPMLLVFDAPDALQGLGQRPATTVAPQALLLMNHPAIRKAALAFARRIAPETDTPWNRAVQNAYLLALSRPPTVNEEAQGIAFIQSQVKLYGAEMHEGSARELALADFCQVLMCLNEFLYIE